MESPLIPIGLQTSNTLRSLESKLDTSLEKGAPDETVKKFESVLATLLVKEMRRSLPEGFFGGGADGDIYSGWLDDQVGQTLADRDALHLRDLITRSVLQKHSDAATADAPVAPGGEAKPMRIERAETSRMFEIRPTTLRENDEVNP